MRRLPSLFTGFLLLCAPFAAAQAAPDPQGQVGAGVAGSITKDSKTGTLPGAGDATTSREESATGAVIGLTAIAPAPAPPGPQGRPRIGLALGGGGALAMSEIGVLQWFEEHHIPVDVVAGTSMGCMVGALYSTGNNIDQLKVVMNDDVFSSVFAFNSSYRSRNFRRREDSRDLPNGIPIGLKHGVSFRNSVLTDQGLNQFLDRQFFRYDDRTDFNTLPIPLRCISTDLTDAKVVTFARGSLPDAVRASVSLPAVYSPFRLNGHDLVDGGVLNNLPTTTVQDMKADVILAVSLPLSPLKQGDLGSILGVLQRSFSVAIEGEERRERKLANVVMTPDIQGFSQADYLKTADLATRGYAAAEAQKEGLLRYAVSNEQWQTYLAARAGRRRGPAGTILRIRVKAPTESAQRAIERKFVPLVNQPVDTRQLDRVLAEVRSDGRYNADYTVGYETGNTDRPVILVTVLDKAFGPPFLTVGANVEALAGGISRATIEGIFLDQDLGNYGSELRATIKAGWETELSGEYARRIRNTGLSGGFFLAPAGSFTRKPYNIFLDQRRLAERNLQTGSGGVDLGWTNSRTRELRLGYQIGHVAWTRDVGDDGAPDIHGNYQRARARAAYDTQDRALIPQFGVRAITEVAFLHSAVRSPDAPQLTTELSLAHARGKNDFVLAAEGGTMFNRDVAQPFRFTLGGPLRLTASNIDEYRGTDYFLLEPAYLRRIAKLPAPLGQSIYLGGAYEIGQMRAPNQRTTTRQDVFFGVVAETPLGVITLAPAIGDDGHRKFVFTLGKLF